MMQGISYALFMKSVLFVCTGNICRSPSADGIMRHLASARGLELDIDSCGTHGYHIGEPPDPRSIAVAADNGVDLSSLRARKLDRKDFERFDLLLAMDSGHLSAMQRLCPAEHAHKLRLFLEDGSDVPDPYYGDVQGFEHVYRLCYERCEELLSALG